MKSLTNQLPAHDQGQEDRIVACYDLALQGKPSVEDFLALAHGDNPRLLVELLLRHLKHQLKAHHAARIEDYLARYTKLANNRRAKVALIRGERELRGLATEAACAEYGQRFPDCRDELGALFASSRVDPSPSVPEDKPLASTCHESAATGPYEPGGGAGTDEEVPRSRPLRYQTLRFHAKGGLGEVFVAEDLELRREVALKEIQERFANESASRRRFVMEAEITGNLEHPGIVPVYGLGTHPDGRPYYAMRFIRGENMDAAIKRFHGSPGSDFGSLEFRGLLRRFIDTCNAVAYAHSRGVIHRDLKPLNVMLGEFGETLVVDWGLAKVLATPLSPLGRGAGGEGPSGSPAPQVLRRLGLGDDDPETVTGAVVGTLAYVSPEQAAGNVEQVGPGSDVYSLGATLFNILTGKPSVGPGARDEMLARTRRGERLTPESVRPDAPKALAAICTKAMALRPEERYAAATHLAKDVDRWLADEPVAAYPEPLSLRVRRWSRRHRTLVTSAVVALVGVVTLLSVSLLLVDQQRRAIAGEKELTEEQRVAAVAARDRGSKIIEDVFNDETLDALKRQTDLTPEQKEFLTNMLRYYQEFVTDEPQDEEGRARLARAYFRMGLGLNILGRKEEARDAFQKALVIAQKLSDEFVSVPEYRHDLAKSHNNCGLMSDDLGDRREAEGAYRQALDLFAKLAADFPDVPQYRQNLAKSHYNLGNVHQARGQREDAERAKRQSLAIFAKLVADFPTEPAYRNELAGSLVNLGNLIKHFGNGADAEDAYAEALAVYEKLTSDFPVTPAYRAGLAQCQTSRGACFKERGTGEQAETAYRHALAIREELAATFPTMPTYRQDLATNLNNLGALATTRDQWAEAEGFYQRAVAIQEKLATDFYSTPEFRKNLATYHANLGHLFRHLKRWGEAEAPCRQTVAILEQLVVDFPTVHEYRQNLATELDELGTLLRRLGKPQEAVKVYQQAVAQRKQLAADFPGVPAHLLRLADNHHSIGLLLKGLQGWEEAQGAFAEALAIYQRLASDFPNEPKYRNNVAATHQHVAALLSNGDKWQEAAEAVRQALAIQTELAAAFSSSARYRENLAFSYNTLGSCLLKLAQPIEAERAYRQALTIQERLVADFPNVPDHVISLAGSYCNLGSLVLEHGQASVALGWFQKAIAALEPVLGQDATARQFLRNSHWGKADAFDALGRHAEAAPDWQRALELDDGSAQAELRAGLVRSRLRAALHQDLAWPLLWSWPRW